jgi:hypothetical protein
VTAGFVDPDKILDGTFSRVHSLDDFIQDLADALQHALVGFILRIDRQHTFARGVGDHLTGKDFAQFAVLAKQPGDELIDRVLLGQLRRKRCHEGKDREERGNTAPRALKILGADAARKRCSLQFAGF